MALGAHSSAQQMRNFTDLQAKFLEAQRNFTVLQTEHLGTKHLVSDLEMKLKSSQSEVTLLKANIEQKANTLRTLSEQDSEMRMRNEKLEL